MKITITNDKKESGENVFYVPSMLFASIVATLQEYGCLKRDAELQRAADQHEQENACNWDNVSSPDFDGCNGCKFSCALGHFPNRSVGD